MFNIIGCTDLVVKTDEVVKITESRADRRDHEVVIETGTVVHTGVIGNDPGVVTDITGRHTKVLGINARNTVRNIWTRSPERYWITWRTTRSYHLQRTDYGNMFLNRISKVR